MKSVKKALTGLLPLLVVFGITVPVLPSQAQTASPLSQALSSASPADSQALTVTAKAVSPAALPPMAQEAVKSQPVSAISQQPVDDMPAAPAKPRHEDARRTLFIEVAQRKLRLEAPEKMCFLDRTFVMQQGIYLLLAAAAERKGDQVLLGVFMPCDDISSPDSWQNGLPDAGFITWLNPGIGSVTSMDLPDYLDMREASFMQYAKDMNIGTKPDKTVHRSEYNVSLAFIDDEGATQPKSTSIIATTLLRQVPVEITLHLTGNPDANKAAPSFSEAYAMMDTLAAQLVTLNK